MRFAIALLAAIMAAGAAQAATLTVTVTNAAEGGEVRAMLFRDADSFSRQSHGPASFAMAPRGGTASATFNDLPPGRYAIAVFHDRNGNQALDTNLFGLPSEPYGFSVYGGLRSPGFDDAAFVVDEPGSSVTVTLRGP